MTQAEGPFAPICTKQRDWEAAQQQITCTGALQQSPHDVIFSSTVPDTQVESKAAQVSKPDLSTRQGGSKMGRREHHSGIIHLSLELFSSLWRGHTSHTNPHRLSEAAVRQCVQPKAQELSTRQQAGAVLRACKVPFSYTAPLRKTIYTPVCSAEARLSSELCSKGKTQRRNRSWQGGRDRVKQVWH